MHERLLTLDDVHLQIGDVSVLNGVSLQVDAGAAVGLVGETGSGKTMTARAACGLLPRVRGRITRGSITLAGQDLTRATERTWRHFRGRTVALVPQSSMSGLDPVMPVGRQLRETIRILSPRANPRARADELLRDVQLEPDIRLLSAYPHQLSGGMRQRVMIALALAGDPPLIIADEPTTALDSTVQFEIIALLGELRRERQLGLLLVSHDLGLIESATDTVVVMYGGMTVESGSTSDVLRAHTHPYTRALLYARPERAQPGRLLRAIPGQPPAPGEVGAGCPFAPRCPEALPDCTTESPPVVEVAPGHQVRCVLPQAVGRS